MSVISPKDIWANVQENWKLLKPYNLYMKEIWEKIFPNSTIKKKCTLYYYQ